MSFPQRFPHCKFNFLARIWIGQLQAFLCIVPCKPITTVVGVRVHQTSSLPGCHAWKSSGVTKKGIRKSLTYHQTELASTHALFPRQPKRKTAQYELISLEETRSDWVFSRMLLVMSVKLLLTNQLLKVNSALKPVFSVIEDQCSGGHLQWSSKWGRQHFSTSSRKGGRTQFSRHQQCCVKASAAFTVRRASLKRSQSAKAKRFSRTIVNNISEAYTWLKSPPRGLGLEKCSRVFESRGFVTLSSLKHLRPGDIDAFFPSPEKLFLAEKHVLESEIKGMIDQESIIISLWPQELSQ